MYLAGSPTKAAVGIISEDSVADQASKLIPIFNNGTKNKYVIVHKF